MRYRTQAREAMTVKELCGEHLAAADQGLTMGKRRHPKKASPTVTDCGRIHRHIIPLVGSQKVCGLASPTSNASCAR